VGLISIAYLFLVYESDQIIMLYAFVVSGTIKIFTWVTLGEGFFHGLYQTQRPSEDEQTTGLKMKSPMPARIARTNSQSIVVVIIVATVASCFVRSKDSTCILKFSYSYVYLRYIKLIYFI
jgi:hypothetical protein